MRRKRIAPHDTTEASIAPIGFDVWNVCVLIGNDGRIRWRSSMPEALSDRGLSKSEATGMPVWDGVHDADVFRSSLMDCIATGTDQSFEIETADGRQHVDLQRTDGLVVCLSRQLGTPPYLTETERQVLGLMADDLTSKEIAFRLDSSESAVNTHRAALRAKFGVRTVAGLMLAAQCAGMISREITGPRPGWEGVA